MICEILSVMVKREYEWKRLGKKKRGRERERYSKADSERELKKPVVVTIC